MKEIRAMRIIITIACLCAVGWLTPLAARAADAENLVANPGFEEPADAQEDALPASWEVFTSKESKLGIIRSAKRSGEQCLRIMAQGLAKGYQGVSVKMDVTPGEKYTFSAFVMNNRAAPLGGTGHGQLCIEWHDASGKELSRQYGTLWNSSLSKMRWELVSLRDQVAPKFATTAIFGIHLSEGDKGGEGSYLVDDVSITR